MTHNPPGPEYRAFVASLVARARAAIDSHAAKPRTCEPVQLRLDDDRLVVRCAGASVSERLLPAFAGLLSPHREAGGETDAIPAVPEILAFDTASSGIQPPPPPFPLQAIRERGVVEAGDGLTMAFQVGADTLSVWDEGQQRGVFWTRDAEALPYYETGAPLRHLLQWWGAGRGWQLVHAAAVGTRAGAALLVGPGGSGKSTCALRCLGSRLSYLADDYCMVRREPTARVHALYTTAKVKNDYTTHAASLAKSLSSTAHIRAEKRLYFLHPQHEEQLLAAAPLAMILVPTIRTQGELRTEPFPRAMALAALAPSSIFQVAGAGSSSFRFLTMLVADLPCRRLLLGPDMAHLSEVIEGALAEASEGGS